MGYYTRSGNIIGDGNLSSNKSAVYDLNSILLNPFVSFQPITFSNCGATGPTGPTLAQCQATYSASVLSALSVNYGYQSFTIPNAGTYRFTVKGASGGVWQFSPMSSTTAANCPTIDGYKRLPGARVSAEYILNTNDVITMVIGQGGGDDTNNIANCPGGGGGTFVTLGTFSDIQSGADTLLFAAGGGAGSGYQSSDNPTLNYPNGRGQSGTSGGSATESGATNGFGTSGSQTGGNSSGGGGYLSGPGNNTSPNFTYTVSNARAAGFRNGATGGTYTGSSRGFGGFGCGGHGASTTGSDDDKGGGGGYSGGGYAFDAHETGGGGGSFITGSASYPSYLAGGNTTDRHGSVYMELV